MPLKTRLLIALFLKNRLMNISKLIIKKLILISLLLGVVFAIQAQNTLVMGKIKNAKLVRTIDLRINLRYLDNTVETYTSNIIDDNTFAFAIQITEPQLVSLEYSRNTGMLYLEPNDTLYIDCDAENFQFSFEFSGRAAHNNKCFTQYQRLNPPETSIFQMTQYRQKNYSFLNSKKMDDRMMTMDKASFKNHMLTSEAQYLSILNKYDEDHPTSLTEHFKEFMKADITFHKAYHLLLYGHVFKNMHDVTSEFFEFLKDIPFQSEAVGNQWYREFLVAYFDRMNMQANVDDTQYAFEYDIAKDHLNGKALAFYRSEIIARAFRAKKQDLILDRYYQFVNKNEYPQFDMKVLATYGKAMKFAKGTPAPDFMLQDIKDETLTLSSFSGKAVYLNFWATWCKPCMKKMEETKGLQAELEKDGIVFLNVSLDRKEEIWKETIAKNNYKGIHVLASGELNSEIAKAYEVRVLPQYFIINKKGEFVQEPKLLSVNDLKTVLVRTANK